MAVPRRLGDGHRRPERLGGRSDALPLRRDQPVVAEASAPRRAARVQLSVLIGIFVLLKAVAYWLDRYELVIKPNSLFTGAGYTDVNALLPAKTILTFVALISAALFFVNVFRRTWRLAVLSLGLHGAQRGRHRLRSTRASSSSSR